MACIIRGGGGGREVGPRLPSEGEARNQPYNSNII